jgi:hypothetical protein
MTMRVWRSFGRRQAATEVGGAAGVPGGFRLVAEYSPGLGEDLARVTLAQAYSQSPAIWKEGRLGVVAGGGRVATGEGYAGAEHQAIGVAQPVIPRSGEV